jgi:hypothetical protein
MERLSIENPLRATTPLVARPIFRVELMAQPPRILWRDCSVCGWRTYPQQQPEQQIGVVGGLEAVG